MEHTNTTDSRKNGEIKEKLNNFGTRHTFNELKTALQIAVPNYCWQIIGIIYRPDIYGKETNKQLLTIEYL